MKKVLFMLFFILLSFTCFSSGVKQECDHDFKLVKIEDGKRYWVCEICGYSYVAKPAKEKIQITLPVPGWVIAVLVLSYFVLCSILISCKGKDFDKERHCRNTVYFLLPFFTVFGLSVKYLWDEWSIIGPMLSLLLALFASMFGMLLSNSINIAMAKKYDLPDDDRRVQEEINKRKAGLFAMLFSIFYIGNKTKNAIKDISNVDSWKEMK